MVGREAKAEILAKSLPNTSLAWRDNFVKQAIVFLAFVLVAGAQVVPDRYIVELSTDPVARFVANHRKRLVVTDPDIVAHRIVIRNEQSRAQHEIEQGAYSTGWIRS
jgi:hypothetical protein